METNNPQQKPVIGVSVGDINGIGPELIVKTFSDTQDPGYHRTPVIFGLVKLISFYKRTLGELPFNFQIIKDFTRINHRQVNLFPVWEEDIPAEPGQITPSGGIYAIKSLVAAATALKENRIDGLVTAPIHKNNTQSADFDFTGHTPYLKHLFGAQDVVMLMVALAISG